jgi:hypothetical protein
MVYKRVMLVLFFTLNVVFSVPLCFSAFLCFNEPFYIFVSIDLTAFQKPSALTIQCGVLGFCVGHFLILSFILCFQ